MFRQEGAILREFTGTKEYHYTTLSETIYFARSIWMTTLRIADGYRYLYRYMYCIQNINCLKSVLEVAHYHTFWALMLFKFTCSKVLIIQWYQWWCCVTQFGVLDLCSVVLVRLPEDGIPLSKHFGVRYLSSIVYYDLYLSKFIFWLMWCVISTWDFSHAKRNTYSHVRERNLVSTISFMRFRM